MRCSGDCAFDNKSYARVPRTQPDVALLEIFGEVIDPSCETVHRDICTASAEIVKLRTQTGRRDLADETRNTAVMDFGCPAGQPGSP